MTAAFSSWRLEAAYSAGLQIRLAPVLARRRKRALAAAFETLVEEREEQQHARLVRLHGTDCVLPY